MFWTKILVAKTFREASGSRFTKIDAILTAFLHKWISQGYANVIAKLSDWV